MPPTVHKICISDVFFSNLTHITYNQFIHSKYGIPISNPLNLCIVKKFDKIQKYNKSNNKTDPSKYVFHFDIENGNRTIYE